MVRRLAKAENHFGYTVPQGAMVVDFGEAEIFEGQVPDAFQSRFNIGCARANVFQQGSKLIFHHS
jgi:hypothetical protein